MLIVHVHNDGTGTDKCANYTYKVYVNNSLIDFGYIKGHNRDDGYRKLLQMLIDSEFKFKDEDIWKLPE